MTQQTSQTPNAATFETNLDLACERIDYLEAINFELLEALEAVWARIEGRKKIAEIIMQAVKGIQS